jgi:hypothetical protein
MKYANPVLDIYGLLWYTQSSLVTQEMNKTTTIVHLMEPLMGKDNALWLDNFYNSPALARLPKHKGTDCVGTLKINR